MTTRIHCCHLITGRGIEKEPALVKIVGLRPSGLLQHMFDTRSNVQVHCARLFLDNEEAESVVEQDTSKIYAIRLGDSRAARSTYVRFMQQVRSAHIQDPRAPVGGLGGAQEDSVLAACISRLFRAIKELRRACKRRGRLYDRHSKCPSATVSEAVLATAWENVIKAEDEDRLARCAVVDLMSQRILEQEERELREDERCTRGWEYETIHHGADAFVCSMSKPRVATQAATCDPAVLLDKASFLNLSLMKWQLYPSLKLDLISNTKCLILGAGTLGCAVGRALLSWRFQKITFIDNDHVSYSNPSRQCLYELGDCIDKEEGDGRGRQKACAAAEACNRVNPNIDCKGIVMEIPFPGIFREIKRRDAADKAVAASLQDLCQSQNSSYIHKAHTDLMINQDIRKCLAELRETIDEHDIVFNVLDSKEARWLPTLLCAASNKFMITGAVGFDSYLVMRHGSGPVSPASNLPTAPGGNDSCSGTVNHDHVLPSARLGCYFCSDLTSGTGGTAYEDRRLDQQCSVTRPGMSGIVGGLCTELAVELIQQKEDIEQTTKVKIPHQLRGSLCDWTQECLTVPATDTCVACSHNIVGRYLSLEADQESDTSGIGRHRMPKSTGVEFVVEVCMDQTGQKLEEAAGSSVLIDDAEKRMKDILLTEDSLVESQSEQKTQQEDGEDVEL